MPSRTRSMSGSRRKSDSVNGSNESPNKSEKVSKSQSKKRSSSGSRRSAERSSSKSRSSRSRSRSRSRSQPKSELNQSDRSLKEAKDTEQTKSEKKAIVRQKTPPRPRPPVEQEQPERSSLRLRERQLVEVEKKTTVEKVIKNTGNMSDKVKSVPKTKEYSFGGPFGSFALMLFLPVITYLLNFVCLDNNNIGRQILAPKSWLKGISLATCLDMKTSLIFFGWLLFQSIIACLPIGGKQVKGLPLHSSGKRLVYNCNGFFALIVTLLTLGVGAIVDRYKSDGQLKWLTYVVDHYFQLMVVATIFSVALSISLYIKSLFAPAHALAPEGNSGCTPYDFFMGHELNPRIGKFDLKFFCEFRPGLIGWVVLDIAFCVKYWQVHHELNAAMIAVTLFHLLYVGDAMYFEESILSTMDIIHEGFGFMLAFGDIVWVPFTYTLTTQFLLTHPKPSVMCQTIDLTLATIVCLVGYWIFRGANSQKDQFRRDPSHLSVAALESIPTSSGRRLLAGGWWGIVRHPNYLGDIIMSIGWSIPCGFRSLLPWFYPAYLTALLVGRELRDEQACIKKHGHGWKKYQELVPYRIFPRVF